ncbi:MAG: tail fiber domain-containing protein [Elusimicrobia bacterium]|nr:tail fiber domain-containing protein [Elusimicrobiota bacterium]
MPLKRTLGILGTLCLLAAPSAWAGAPDLISYQGRLQENGALVTGPRDVEIRLCDQVGTCYSTGVQAVQVNYGIFRTTFTTAALPPGALASGSWFIEVGVNGNYLSPREQLSSTPYALMASSVPSSGIEFNPAGPMTALGYQAGIANTGLNNTFLGYRAGYSNTAASDNAFFGHMAGQATTVGNANSFLGALAGRSNLDGNGGTFLGSGAGFSNTGGDANTFVGYQAGYDNTLGNNGTFVGHNSGQNNITGGNNAFIGQAAGYTNTSGSDNSYLGFQAGYGGSAGNSNSMVGYRAGFNSAASSDTFIGFMSGYSNTTGLGNTYLGSQAGFSNLSGSGNLFLGYQAGYSEVGSDKLYIDNSGTPAPLIWGDFGTDVVVVNGSLQVQAPVGVTTAGLFSAPMDAAVTIRSNAGSERATRLNFDSWSNGQAGMRSMGSLGFVPAGHLTFETSNDGNASGTERMRISAVGNVGIGTVNPASRLDLGGGCMTGSVCSDARLKRDIQPLAEDGSYLERVLRLQGASFEWTNLGDGKRYVGLIAQDVEKVLPEVVMTSNSNDEQKGLSCTGLDAVLIEAVKEQQRQIESLKAEVQALKDGVR